MPHPPPDFTNSHHRPNLPKQASGTKVLIAAIAVRCCNGAIASRYLRGWVT
ncbi:predicted protein [Plenodomus lingam JN3]|uniref:Predicted protein n=1 Tax=Leptosphaeria maculans (strain JN3 / isolate v23.1.3 / race Av1-4-5-6-7-8) TaxID=985895 RepID=E4ZLJ3_LEPMJ|nr:predicted protein [Plenodomus lingam JN3]CBX92673.1 predicted protein [Plenodomus lingam JN3]